MFSVQGLKTTKAKAAINEVKQIAVAEAGGHVHDRDKLAAIPALDLQIVCWRLLSGYYCEDHPSTAVAKQRAKEQEAEWRKKGGSGEAVEEDDDDDDDEDDDDDDDDDDEEEDASGAGGDGDDEGADEDGDDQEEDGEAAVGGEDTEEGAASGAKKSKKDGNRGKPRRPSG